MSDCILISKELRLRPYDGVHDFALAWYQDAETVRLVDGVPEPYDCERLERMYSYLNSHGELYFIEVLEDGTWFPIGDVAFWQDDLPIVIGDKRYRGRGVGRAVVSALLERARARGWKSLRVGDIYDFNEGSRRLFTSLGFRESGKTEKGHSYTFYF